MVQSLGEILLRMMRLFKALGDFDKDDEIVQSLGEILIRMMRLFKGLGRF